jgi:hypothetical protein
VQVNLDCSNLERMVHALPLVRGCDVVRNGALRMSTPFFYPNGDHIDVFLQRDRNLFQSLSLSDYGQTALYLRSAQVKMEATARKKEIIEGILGQLGVRLKGGDLFVNIPDSDSPDISDAIFRLSQACLRISDFVAHQRLRGEVKVQGRFKDVVPVDFEVFGKERKSYVCVLATMTASGAHASATETFRKWYDIAEPGGSGTHELVTVYNSTTHSLKEADKQRLRGFSKLISYPAEQDFLKATLVA